jgi:ribosomal protein S1
MTEEIQEAVVEEAPQAEKPSSINDLKPKMQLSGTVQRMELYGAFIDLGIDVPGLVHISQLSTERVNRVADVLTVGQEVTVWVDKVDSERNQLMVTMVEPLAVDWSDLKAKEVYTGRVSRLENFGAFINIGAEREGLVHISELSHDYVKHPSEVLKIDDEVQVQVLGFSKRKRRIDLSIKALLEKPEPEAVIAQVVEHYDDIDDDYEEDDVLPTAMEIALRRAMGEPASDRRDKRNRKRTRRERMRNLQEDLLARTLHLQQEGE